MITAEGSVSLKLYDPVNCQEKDVVFSLEVDGYPYRADDYPGEILYEVGDWRLMLPIYIDDEEGSHADLLYYKSMLTKEHERDIYWIAQQCLLR